MGHEIFFPVPPTQPTHDAIRYINAKAELFQLPMLNMQSPHRSVALAKVSGQEIGYCVYSLEKKRIKIERIVIQPSYRRRGIATDMINDIAERFSPCTVQITLDAHNTDANDWARAVGFGATKFIRGCESGSDRVQLEFMEIGSVS